MTSAEICSMRCRVPTGCARPGRVTSTASAPMRASMADAASSARRSRNAASSAWRTSLDTLPTAGRSSGESVPSPRRIAVREPFLPRSSTRAASKDSSLSAPTTAARPRSSSSRSSSVMPIYSEPFLGLQTNERSRSPPLAETPPKDGSRLPRYHLGWPAFADPLVATPSRHIRRVSHPPQPAIGDSGFPTRSADSAAAFRSRLMEGTA